MATRRAARATTRRPVRRRRNHHCGYHPEGDPRAYPTFAAFARDCAPSRRRNPRYPWGESLADDAVALHREGFRQGHRFALRTRPVGSTKAALVKHFERAAANDRERWIDASIVVTVARYHPRHGADLMRAFTSGVRAGFDDVAEMRMEQRR